MTESKMACAHQRVIYRPNGNDVTGWCPRWVCDSCETEFVPGLVAEIAVRQAHEIQEALRAILPMAETWAWVRRANVMDARDAVDDAMLDREKNLNRAYAALGMAHKITR